MARVKFTAGEIVQNFQIQDAIRRTLETERVASMDRSVIESSYELEDDDGQVMDGSVDDKCQAIAARLNVDVSVRDELVIFRRKRK